MHGVPLLGADAQITPNPHQYAFASRDRMDENEDTSRTARDRRFRYIRHLHPDRAALQHTQYPDQLATWSALRQIASQEARQVASGDAKSLFTPLQRSLVAPFKPAEELYDLQNDPHETTNVADAPQYADDLQRLRQALQHWQRDVGDLGLIPEPELIERWRPGGRTPTTEAPQLSRSGDHIVAHCDTPGALIAWTTDPPGDSATPTAQQRVTGDPATMDAGGGCTPSPWLCQPTGNFGCAPGERLRPQPRSRGRIHRNPSRHPRWSQRGLHRTSHQHRRLTNASRPSAAAGEMPAWPCRAEKLDASVASSCVSHFVHSPTRRFGPSSLPGAWESSVNVI